MRSENTGPGEQHPKRDEEKQWMNQQPSVTAKSKLISETVSHS
jgi:hypothetical protein